MSRIEFTKATSATQYGALLNRLVSQSNPYTFGITPWLNAISDTLSPHAQSQRIAKLEGYLKDHPDFPDAARWQTEIEDIRGAGDKDAAIVAEQRVTIAQWLKDHGYGDVAVTQDPNEPNANEFTLMMTKGEAKEFHFSSSMPTVKTIKFRQTGFNLSGLSEKEQKNLFSFTARTFRDMLDYMDATIDKPELHKLVSRIKKPDGPLADMENGQSSADFAKAVASLHTNKVTIISTPKGTELDTVPGLSFGLIRSFLAVQAYWAGDAKAKKFLDTMNDFMANYEGVNSGLRGECPQQDIVGFISDMAKKPLKPLLEAPFRYLVQISPPELEGAKERLTEIHLEIEKIDEEYQKYGENTDFTNYVETLKSRTIELVNEESKIEQEQKQWLETSKAETFETIRSIVAELHAKKAISIDPERDVSRTHDASMCLYAYINATSKDIETLRQTEFFKDVHISRQLSPWSVIEGIAKSDPASDYIPGVLETRPGRSAFTSDKAPAPAIP